MKTVIILLGFLALGVQSQEIPSSSGITRRVMDDQDTILSNTTKLASTSTSVYYNYNYCQKYKVQTYPYYSIL